MNDELQDYKDANLIRMEYPKVLDGKMICEILNKWSPYISTSRSDMFYFSVSSPWNREPNLSELELFFRFQMGCYEHELRTAPDCLEDGCQKITGMTFSAWLNLLMYNTDPKSENLRSVIIDEMLQMWKTSAKNFEKQKDGMITRIAIKNKVEKDMLERYPDYKNHLDKESFEGRMWRKIENFIKNN